MLILVDKSQTQRVFFYHVDSWIQKKELITLCPDIFSNTTVCIEKYALLYVKIQKKFKLELCCDVIENSWLKKPNSVKRYATDR
jgi:hypothetical protein